MLPITFIHPLYNLLGLRFSEGSRLFISHPPALWWLSTAWWMGALSVWGVLAGAISSKPAGGTLFRRLTCVQLAPSYPNLTLRAVIPLACFTPGGAWSWAFEI